MAMRTPRFLSWRRTWRARSMSRMRTPSVISSSSRAAERAGLEQDGLHEGGQIAMGELKGREVDGDRERLRPAGRFPAGRPQHELAERADQPGLLGEGDEGRRRDRAQGR